jgi:hypothetical protein
MTRVVEGNHRPGNRLTGDDVSLPTYCPVCGLELVRQWGWTTVEGDSYFPSIVCYGAAPDWLVWLWQHFAPYPVDPAGAHYQYNLPTRDIHALLPFDRSTGQPR